MEANKNITQLYAKLFNVQQNVENFPMNGYNNYSGYAYPLFQDIVETLKPQLHTNKLFFYFTTKHCYAGRTSDGKKSTAYLEVEAVVVDCESGAYITNSIPAYAEDTGDKATYQANTNGRKYALLALFGLNSGFDQETDYSTPKQQAPKQKKSSDSSSII